MTLSTLVRNLSGRRHRRGTAADARAAQREERSRRAVRCDACNVWSQSLLRLANGGAYCRRCARRVAAPSLVQATTHDAAEQRFPGEHDTRPPTLLRSFAE